MSSENENKYKVIWEIDLYAESPEEAAEDALKIHRNPNSIATIFNVVHEAPANRFGKEINATYPLVDHLSYYYQYVIFEPDKSGSELYLLKSSDPITVEEAVEWAETEFGDINWEKDSITFVDPPTEEFITSQKLGIKNETDNRP